ncbi:MAG TPA: hypothetical protein VEU06_05035 [Micropepsaceae bacterium]|nr:hypothetical protein [Micropepsaceae bacterium]
MPWIAHNLAACRYFRIYGETAFKRISMNAIFKRLSVGVGPVIALSTRLPLT